MDRDDPRKEVQYCTPDHGDTYYLLTLYNLGVFGDETLKNMNPDSFITRREFAKWAAALKHPVRGEGTQSEEPLPRAELAEFVVGLSGLDLPKR